MQINLTQRLQKAIDIATVIALAATVIYVLAYTDYVLTCPMAGC